MKKDIKEKHTCVEVGDVEFEKIVGGLLKVKPQKKRKIK